MKNFRSRIRSPQGCEVQVHYLIFLSCGFTIFYEIVLTPNSCVSNLVVPSKIFDILMYV